MSTPSLFEKAVVDTLSQIKIAAFIVALCGIAVVWRLYTR
jgi:hypothetical protein